MICKGITSAFYENSTRILFRDLFHRGSCHILSPHDVIGYWKAYSIDCPYYSIDHSLGCVCVDQVRIHSEGGYAGPFISVQDEIMQE